MWHPDPDQLALAALPAEPRDDAVERHLAGCALCRRHVESLRRTVDLAVAGAADGSEYGEPPDRVWAAITGELRVTPGPDPAVPRVPLRRRAVVPVAAALVALVVGLGVGWAAGSAPPQPGRLVALDPVDPNGPGATGTAGITGDRGLRVVVVHVEGTAPPPGSDYLEAWLMDTSGGGLVSLGALSRDGDGYRGEFSVPSDLPTARFTALDVSAERFDGDERHSQISLLRGVLD